MGHGSNGVLERWSDASEAEIRVTIPTLLHSSKPFPLPAFENGRAVVAVHLGDEVEVDFLRASGFAGASDGAVAEAFFVHSAAPC